MSLPAGGAPKIFRREANSNDRNNVAVELPRQESRQFEGGDGESSRSGCESAGSDREDAQDLEAFLPREVSLRQVLAFLAQDVKTVRNYKAMPLYLVFLFMFTLLILVTQLWITTENFHLNKGAEDLVATSELMRISSMSDLWPWLRTATGRLWAVRPYESCSELFDVSPHTMAQGVVYTAANPRPYSVSDSADCCAACWNDPTCTAWIFKLKDKGGAGTCQTVVSYRSRHTAVTSMLGVRSVNKSDAQQRPVVNVPVGAVVLRQWRSHVLTCPVSDAHFVVLGPRERDVLRRWPGGCADSWADSGNDAEPFGPDSSKVPLTAQHSGSPTWRSDGELEDTTRVPPVGTERGSDLREYSSTNDQFSQVFDLHQNLSVVHAMLDELEAHNWVDTATRAVVFEFFLFSPELSFAGPTFAHFTGFVESLVHGTTEASFQSAPFAIWSLSGLGGFVFGIDVLLALVLLYFLLEFIQDLLRKRKLVWATGESLVGIWEVFEVLNLLTFTVTYVNRFKLWVLSRQLTDDGYFEEKVKEYGQCGNLCEQRVLFDSLSRYSDFAKVSSDFYAPSIIIAYIRLFKFLQHNQRLNVLSQTMSEAVDDLLGMLFIFGIILVGYSLAGALLFGAEIKDFSTLDKTMSYLTRVIFSGEVSLWEDMKMASSLWTAPFLFTWMILCWLILLNMVLAVIAGSFSVIQEAMDKTQDRWRLPVVGRDLCVFAKKYLLRQPERKDKDDPDDAKKCDRRWIEQYCERRTGFMVAIKKHYVAEEGKDRRKVPWERRYVTQQKLRKIAERARRDDRKVLTDLELLTLVDDVSIRVAGDSRRGSERGLATLLASVGELRVRMERLHLQVSNLHMSTEKQAGMISEVGVTAKAAVTRLDDQNFALDKVGERQQERLDAVANDLSAAFSDVVRGQEQLAHLADDITAGVERQIPILEEVRMGVSPSRRRAVHVPIAPGFKTAEDLSAPRMNQSIASSPLAPRDPSFAPRPSQRSGTQDAERLQADRAERSERRRRRRPTSPVAGRSARPPPTKDDIELSTPLLRSVSGSAPQPPLATPGDPGFKDPSPRVQDSVSSLPGLRPTQARGSGGAQRGRAGRRQGPPLSASFAVPTSSVSPLTPGLKDGPRDPGFK